MSQNKLLLKHGYVYCRLCNCEHGYIDDPPTLNLILSSFSLPLHHSCDELFQALYHFSILQATESYIKCKECTKCVENVENVQNIQNVLNLNCTNVQPKLVHRMYRIIQCMSTQTYAHQTEASKSCRGVEAFFVEVL